MANPFSGVVHPLARAAAEALQRQLGAPAGAGQMFGVLLVAATDGRIGVLRAFSGTWRGSWLHPGFAPPLFDVAERDALWAAASVDSTAPRDQRSRQLWAALCAACSIPDARGGRRSLASLFAPAPPPGGAGECAAPKLLAQAFAHGLRPLALAEFWWGAAARAGGSRRQGEPSDACAASVACAHTASREALRARHAGSAREGPTSPRKILCARCSPGDRMPSRAIGRRRSHGAVGR